MKSKKGFTLVELVIVIIIVGILSVVSVPIYRGYTIKAYAAEGKALLGAINTAQKIYYAEFGFFANEAETNKGTMLDVDATKNKYFLSFRASTTGSGWSAITEGTGPAEGISLTIVDNNNGGLELYENGILMSSPAGNGGSGSGGGTGGGAHSPSTGGGAHSPSTGGSKP